MSENEPQKPREIDEETIQLATEIFNMARVGDAEKFREWLGHGLPPNMCNHKGDSLLMLASYHGQFDTVKVLLEHGADPEMRNDNGQNPLAGAAFKGDLAMVRLLLENGADVNGSAPDGKTALMFAAMFDHVEITRYLLEQGADPELRESRGMTAGELAQGMGAEQTTALLGATRAD
ncbi:hypothetical protein GCM10010082_05350 [Kushneria pakistanensis]|uniref:Ankyrin repeat domain-containing protein n=1 Tax=Kushneria pakistanensis TaxID=1508770 RepID=A0ABQ3FCB6_9GAMM|nr:ankyrin repeat domain-containing protein [Kushneria pakistanensis]GHC17218.1 hypothetical protein GCM10010082_05350 [Kushneria pakistanensis]